MAITENRARAELYRRATEAWETLKRTHRETWAKYKEIGEAMVDARAEIMRKHELNQPAGPGYQKDMMNWLVEHRLDDMHKTTRSHLCDLIEHIDEVEAMMDGDESNKGWSLEDRMEWNAPNTVHRKWQAWRRKQGHTTDQQRKKLKTAQQTSEELAIALERIKELEEELTSAKSSGGEVTQPISAPVEIDASTVSGALTTLLKFGRLKLEDLGGEMPDPLDLTELGMNLKDIADELKRAKKQAATGKTEKLGL